MSDPRLPVGPMDILGTYQTIAGLRRSKQEEELNRLRLAELYRQSQMEQELAPLKMAATRLDLENERTKVAGERDAMTREWQARAARVLEANPKAAEMVQRRIDQLAKIGRIDHFTVPGRTVSIEGESPIEVPPSEQEIAALEAMGSDEPRYSQQTKQIQNWEFAQENPEAAAYVLGQRPPPQPKTIQDPRPNRAPKQAKASGPKPVDSAKISTQLRKEFQGLPVFKDTMNLASAYEKISTASPTAAGDMSLVFGYMKILDPGSTVREGEYANAKNAGGVPDRIISIYNGAKNGQILTDAQRAAFKKEAQGVFEAQLKKYRQVAEQYKGLAGRQGARPDDVVLDFGYQQPPPPAEVRTPETDSLFDQLKGKR